MMLNGVDFSLFLFLCFLFYRQGADAGKWLSFSQSTKKGKENMQDSLSSGAWKRRRPTLTEVGLEGGEIMVKRTAYARTEQPGRCGARRDGRSPDAW